MHCCVYVCVRQLVMIIGYICHTHFLFFDVVYLFGYTFVLIAREWRMHVCTCVVHAMDDYT